MANVLCDTRCGQCGFDTVELVEQPHLLTETETETDIGNSRFEVGRVVVAGAECRLCEARYLAWVDQSRLPVEFRFPMPDTSKGFFALSYRSTFDRKPGPDDVAKYKVLTSSSRVSGEPTKVLVDDPTAPHRKMVVTKQTVVTVVTLRHTRE